MHYIITFYRDLLFYIISLLIRLTTFLKKFSSPDNQQMNKVILLLHTDFYWFIYFSTSG